MVAHLLEIDRTLQEQISPSFLAGSMSPLLGRAEALFGLLCHHDASSPRWDWIISDFKKAVEGATSCCSFQK